MERLPIHPFLRRILVSGCVQLSSCDYRRDASIYKITGTISYQFNNRLAAISTVNTLPIKTRTWFAIIKVLSKPINEEADEETSPNDFPDNFWTVPNEAEVIERHVATEICKWFHRTVFFALKRSGGSN